MRVVGRHYDSGQPLAVQTDGERIVDLQPLDPAGPLPWIAPGFVDLQVNGYGGQEFNDRDLTVEKVAEVSLAMDQAGVTRYCPTATTHSFEMLGHVMQTLAKACRESTQVARRVAGIHLEGPYICPQDGPRGAHPLEHCRPPDWDEFQRLQQAAEGRIRILTMSPEYDGSPAFIRKVVSSGVLVAIGHTSANSEQIQSAVEHGASMSTHLGNGAHGRLRRHPNYIWDQLADDRLVASLIADGHHLPPAVIKCFVRAKTAERCVVVSDLVGAAGMPAGRYTNTSIGDIEILAEGRIVVAGQNQYLAGAGLHITHGVANMMRFGGVDRKTAVDMAGARPAELIGCPAGHLGQGGAADLVLFDDPADERGPLRVRATINTGEVVYGRV